MDPKINETPQKLVPKEDDRVTEEGKILRTLLPDDVALLVMEYLHSSKQAPDLSEQVPS